MKLFLMAVIFIAFCIYVLAVGKPKITHVKRSLKINAKREEIFAIINDFKQWALWSPYEKDPQMSKVFEGSENGAGAIYKWSGDKNVGEGEITILETTPPNELIMKLHMIRPFDALNDVRFSIENDGADESLVTWELKAPASLFARVMANFVNMDKMIGGDFEIGLARLKAICEK